MHALPVLNHLLWVGFRENNDNFDAIKIQKMLYFLHGWYLAITNEVLIDQPFYKGKYGPVIPEVKEVLKQFGSQAVDIYIEQFDENDFNFKPFFVNLKAKPQFKDILEKVWKEYSVLTSIQLSSMASCENSPWYKTQDYQIISNDLIKDHFVQLAWKNENKHKRYIK